MVQELICIVCPRGCHLKVDPENNYKVTGNMCANGISYGLSEVKNPTRVLTTTVRISASDLTRCPVKTDKAIPKAEMKNIMEEINKVQLTAPVQVGDLVIENVLGTDANVVVCRDIDKRNVLAD